MKKVIIKYDKHGRLEDITNNFSLFEESCHMVKGSKSKFCEALPEFRPKGAMGAPIKAQS